MRGQRALGAQAVTVKRANKKTKRVSKSKTLEQRKKSLRGWYAPITGVVILVLFFVYIIVRDVNNYGEISGGTVKSITAAVDKGSVKNEHWGRGARYTSFEIGSERYELRIDYRKIEGGQYRIMEILESGDEVELQYITYSSLFLIPSKENCVLGLEYNGEVIIDTEYGFQWTLKNTKTGIIVISAILAFVSVCLVVMILFYANEKKEYDFLKKRSGTSN